MVVVAKIAPRAMKAPARTERAKTLAGDMPALATPTFSALRATSAGGSASSPADVKVGCSSIAPMLTSRPDESGAFRPANRHPLPLAEAAHLDQVAALGGAAPAAAAGLALLVESQRAGA